MGCMGSKNKAPEAAPGEQYKVTEPAADGKADAKEAEAPKAEAPKAEAPKAEPKKEAPAKDEDEDEEEDDDDDVVSESEFMKNVDPVKNNKMRTSVSAEAYGEWNKKEDFTPPVYEKNADQSKRLSDTLGKSFMFRALNAKEMDTVISAMEEVVATAGEQLITLGDNGDYLFVIEKGQLECRKEINGVDTLLKTVEEGDVFGELALLYNTVRAANVIAKSDCLLWKLDRNSFTHIVKDAAQKKRERYEGFLSKVPLLRDNGMDNYSRSQVCDGLHNESLKAGDTVITEGEEGKKFYIVESGSFTGIKSGAEDKAIKYAPGDFFGELALLKDAPRAATVTADTDGELLVLDRGAFKRLFAGSAAIVDAMERHTLKY